VRRTHWLLALLAAPAALPAQDLTAADRQAIVAKIWSDARHHFVYWERVQGQWDSALTATLAVAARPQSDVEFLRHLRRYVAILGHGQTEVLPAGRGRDRWARPPLHIAAIEGRPFILDYAENAEMRVARPERLAEIMAVQGVPAERWIEDSVLPAVAGASRDERWGAAVANMLAGPRATALHLLLRLPGGETRGASVTRSVALGARWPLQARPLEVDTLPDGSVWVRLNDLDDADVSRDFDRALPDFAGVRGVLLDVRGATGADARAGLDILARLVHRPFVTVRRRGRALRSSDTTAHWYDEAPDTVAPRLDRPVYGGPVAVLAGPGTGGAAEDLVAAFRNAGRGPLVGDSTAGHGGAAATFALARGWRVRLCAVRHAFPDGAEYAASGIAPELHVPTTIVDVLNGHDAVLTRARQYLAERFAAGEP
jgi:hypothetical protein